MAGWRESIPGGAWPAAMKAGEAAAYLGMSRTNFLRLVAARKIHAGFMICATKEQPEEGRRFWRRRDLDAFLDGLDGTTVASRSTKAGEDLALQRLDNAYPD